MIYKTCKDVVVDVRVEEGFDYQLSENTTLIASYDAIRKNQQEYYQKLAISDKAGRVRAKRLLLRHKRFR
ncbi:MAG: hypothetical protein CVV41_10420 [Candidatus Riflebacteria bacterium HGW-Riflebacteria-1]|jgi:hypothetical protein|nr:MAG: hypothetical protein CVV41_10420 [Candidatus Riflebacteria bacterium HGW-Riflebacteria-1]